MNTFATVLVVVAVLILLVLALAVRVVKQHERGVLFRLGRVIGAREPGLVLSWLSRPGPPGGPLPATGQDQRAAHAVAAEIPAAAPVPATVGDAGESNVRGVASGRRRAPRDRRSTPRESSVRR
jgi:hypothetical protein